MDGKKKFLVSSTPHMGRSRQLLNLFTDIQCSPINVMGPPNVSPLKKGLEPMPSSSTTSEQTKAGAGRKRRIASKAKAEPQSVTTGLLKELGVDGQDIRDNGLSHSRNLYNMFPEPIILDSDEENSVVAKKSIKKPKQDSKVIESITTENQEKKKTKERFPGSSRLSRITCVVADRRAKKQSATQTMTRDPLSIKNLNPPTKNKPHTRSKLPTNQESSNSVVILGDNENDDLFPACAPGADVCSAIRITNKAKDNASLSLELDEKFPIEWGTKPNKPLAVEDSQAPEYSMVIEKNNNKGLVKSIKLTRNKVSDTKETSNAMRPKCSYESSKNKGIISMTNLNFEEEDKDKIERITVQNRAKTKQKPVVSTKGLIRSEQSCNNDNDNQVICTDDIKKEDKVMISSFENIVFKPRRNHGGITARCLKTDKNDIGYLEIPTNEVFRGDTKNITFVVIEGETKVTHQGIHRTLVPGDMINIIEDGGYTFESCGSSQVRFLYIKPHS